MLKITNIENTPAKIIFPINSSLEVKKNYLGFVDYKAYSSVDGKSMPFY